MTLVPEGKIWNYGIGLTQMWMPNMGYSMTLDTPLQFWSEAHRPAAFLTVSTIINIYFESGRETLFAVRKSRKGR